MTTVPEINYIEVQSRHYVKVDFTDDVKGIREWMWLRVNRCDVENRIVYGTLENEPLNDLDRLSVGSMLAVSFSQIRGAKEVNEAVTPN